MKSEASPLHGSILNAWSTNDRVTTFLVEQLPDSLWEAAVPGSSRRTIRVIASHMHNARCSWIKTLGKPHGVAVPQAVDRHRATRSQLVRALKRSGPGIASLLTLARSSGKTRDSAHTGLCMAQSTARRGACADVLRRS